MLPVLAMLGIGVALILTFWDSKIPEVSDWMERPTYAHRKMARWSVRSMGVNVLLLTSYTLLWVATDWLARAILLLAYAVNMAGMRRLWHVRRGHLAQAQISEDKEVDQVVIPDSPKGL